MLQLLHKLDKWTEYLDYGRQIDAVCTDFEKVFDKVPRNSSGDEIANVNFFTTTSYTHYKIQ